MLPLPRAPTWLGGMEILVTQRSADSLAGKRALREYFGIMDTTNCLKNQVRYRVGLDHASHDATTTHGSDRCHQVDAVVGASLKNLSALAQSTRT